MYWNAKIVLCRVSCVVCVVCVVLRIASVVLYMMYSVRCMVEASCDVVSIVCGFHMQCLTRRCTCTPVRMHQITLHTHMSGLSFFPLCFPTATVAVVTHSESPGLAVSHLWLVRARDGWFDAEPAPDGCQGSSMFKQRAEHVKDGCSELHVENCREELHEKYAHRW